MNHHTANSYLPDDWQSTLHCVEGFVRYAFKHTAHEYLYFDIQTLIINVNHFYDRHTLDCKSTLDTLSALNVYPGNLQNFRAAFLMPDRSAFLWMNKHGYPFKFSFDQVFSIHSIERYGLCDLASILVQSGIPL